MSIRSRPVPKALGARLLLALAVVGALMTIQAIVGASPALALSERPDDTHMTNGKVYASALSESGKTLYIGGKFNRVKETRSGGSTVGRAVSNVAAINVKTGALIQTWRPQVTGDGAVVRSLAFKDGTLYIGGNFTGVSRSPADESKPRKNLAAVSANPYKAVRLSSFAPTVGGDTSYVYALETDDSKLYAGGGFSKVDDVRRKNLAAFDLATGALDLEWKPETSVDPACTDPKCSAKVRALELRPGGSSILIGGLFSHITGSDGPGETRQSVARVYTNSGDLHQWKIPEGTIEAPQTAWDLTATANRLYVGFGAQSNFLAAFDIKADAPGSMVWRYRTTGNVQAVELTPDGSRLFFGGHFGLNNVPAKKVCGGKPLRGLASLNPETGTIRCDFIPSLDQPKRPSYEGAWTLITTSSYLWVGGGFKGVSDSKDPKPTPAPKRTEVPQTNLARFTF